jgi:hypothetical protein
MPSGCPLVCVTPQKGTPLAVVTSGAEKHKQEEYVVLCRLVLLGQTNTECNADGEPSPGEYRQVGRVARDD